MRTRLVLVHGSRYSASQWDAYPALLPGIEVVAPDLPGHGTRIGEDFTTAAAIAAIGDAVAGPPRQSVVLAGHSLGGYMSMLYAAAHPTSLAGLALLGSTADPEGLGAGLYRAFASQIQHVGASRMAKLANGMARLAGVRSGLPDGSAYSAIPAAWEAVMRDCRADKLATVTCPVLIVNGQFDQMRLHWRRYRDACLQASVVVIPGATHFAPLTHRHYVAAVLRRFIADIASAER